MGKTVKSSPNSESTVEKFLKWFAALLHHSRFPHFPSGSSICLTNFFCIVKPRWGVGGGEGGGATSSLKTLSGSDSYIFRLSLLAGS